MGKQDIIIEYKGHLTFSTTGRLLTLLKYKMKKQGIEPGIYKKILSIMIEALENIYKNSDQYKEYRDICEKYIPEFRLTKNENSYYIYCANPIRNELIPNLREKLKLVNKKDFEELRLLYRKTIADGKFTNKGGAGLGIIEMAKISGNPLGYNFEEINETFSYYSLEIKFN
jgi:hypothetical protein